MVNVIMWQGKSQVKFAHLRKEKKVHGFFGAEEEDTIIVNDNPTSVKK